MNPILAAALATAALALCLSWSDRRTLVISLTAFAVAAGLAYLMPTLDLTTRVATIVVALLIAAVACVSYLPRGVAARVGPMVALAAGGTFGALHLPPASAALCAGPLLLVPLGRWLVVRGWNIAPRVGASWIVAAALLTGALALVPPQAPAADTHME